MGEALNLPRTAFSEKEEMNKRAKAYYESKRLCVCGGFEGDHCPQTTGCTRFRAAEDHIGIKGRRVDFFMMDDLIVDKYIPRMGMYGLGIYVILCKHADYKTHQTFIGHPRIAVLANIGRRTIQRELDNLVSLGLLKRTSGKVAGLENLYEIVDPRTLEQGAPMATPEGAPMKTGCADKDTEGAPMATPYIEEQELINQRDTSPSLFAAPVLEFPSLQEAEKKITPNPPGGFDALADYYARPIESPPEKTRKVADSRWARIVAEIDQRYQLANPGIDCPWSKLAFKRLKVLLDDAKAWDESTWMRCIRFRFDSLDINPGEPPEGFIPHLKNYVSGPLNEYHKPQNGGSANGSYRDNRTNRLANEAREALDRANQMAAARRGSSADDDPEDVFPSG
jgi:hypothetical protein